MLNAYNNHTCLTHSPTDGVNVKPELLCSLQYSICRRDRLNDGLFAEERKCFIRSDEFIHYCLLCIKVDRKWEFCLVGSFHVGLCPIAVFRLTLALWRSSQMIGWMIWKMWLRSGTRHGCLYNSRLVVVVVVVHRRRSSHP